MTDVISSREPLTVRVANVHLRHVVAVSAVLGGIGGAVLVPAVTGDDAGGVLVSAVFVVFACALPAAWRASASHHRLTVDAAGLRMAGPIGDRWTVTWRELGRVTFSYSRPDLSQPRRGHPVQPPKAELVLSPASPDFRDAHPEMEDLAEEVSGEPGFAYSLPLGSLQRSVGPIDDALSAFAGGIYVRDGREIPRGLRRPWAVVASVALALAFWVPAMGYAALPGGADPADIAMGSFWTAVVLAWLVRVWTGGPMAIGFMKFTATFIGGAFLAVILLLAGMGVGDGDTRSDDLQRYGFGVLLSAGLLLSGLLLGRADVREWCEARAQGR
ncbi:hypothetical protein E1281_18750 [Actinomadura sp. KC345]|uniref:hypothetical protein n=1 Tax=Actinomadura sp. KC345 TaxID=2530371 RepID=UPI00104364F4|nr:hypothetical protein [Actinomadura sp. KC345]TDC52711.1 hypothetical protein E1281_18750 [Actinomadura sp. KC345]